MKDPLKHPRGAKPTQYLLLNGSDPETVDGEVVEETLACISVNGSEVATFMCSPTGLEQLGIGFLYNEGIISSRAEIASVHVSDRDCVEIWLHHEVKIPDRKIVTAGCGGGVTFDDLTREHPPLESNLQAAPEALTALMDQLQRGAEIYLRSRGIHTAVLADPAGPILQVEDLGRHNCLDKLAGLALQNGIDTRDRILLSSGRISSEMMNKARRMGTPIVCSRTSPTSLSLALAEAWNITVVAYLRGRRMRVYTHPGRVIGSG